MVSFCDFDLMGIRYLHFACCASHGIVSPYWHITDQLWRENTTCGGCEKCHFTVQRNIMLMVVC